MNHGKLATAIRFAATDSLHMNEPSPINSPATTPATRQIHRADFFGSSFKASKPSSSIELPRDTSRLISAQATAPAFASASATRHAMFPTGTSTVHNHAYRVQTGYP